MTMTDSAAVPALDWQQQVRLARLEIVHTGDTDLPTAVAYNRKRDRVAFTFTWHDNRWIALGEVPKNVAEVLAADPVSDYIRVAEGHDLRLSSHGQPGLYIYRYEIDNAFGLRIFVDTLRAHGLIA